MHPVTLQGQRTTLREFTAEDLDAVHAIVGDPRVTASLSFDPRDRESAAAMLDGIQARALSEPRTEYYLAITTAPAGLVGFVRLALAGVQAAKLGYAVHADHWRCGHATDAVSAMLAFGFDHLQLHRISAAVGPENVPSLRLVKRLGFSPEGRIRDHVFTNGAWRDSLLFSVLAPEWQQARQAA